MPNLLGVLKTYNANSVEILVTQKLSVQKVLSLCQVLSVCVVVNWDICHLIVLLLIDPLLQ